MTTAGLLPAWQPARHQNEVLPGVSFSIDNITFHVKHFLRRSMYGVIQPTPMFVKKLDMRVKKPIISTKKTLLCGFAAYDEIGGSLAYSGIANCFPWITQSTAGFNMRIAFVPDAPFKKFNLGMIGGNSEANRLTLSSGKILYIPSVLANMMAELILDITAQVNSLITDISATINIAKDAIYTDYGYPNKSILVNRGGFGDPQIGYSSGFDDGWATNTVPYNLFTEDELLIIKGNVSFPDTTKETIEIHATWGWSMTGASPVVDKSSLQVSVDRGVKL